MINKELETDYIQQALTYIREHVPDLEAVFMAGVQFGLDIREQELLSSK